MLTIFGVSIVLFFLKGSFKPTLNGASWDIAWLVFRIWRHYKGLMLNYAEMTSSGTLMGFSLTSLRVPVICARYVYRVKYNLFPLDIDRLEHG
jgi:hypothetical protein